MSVMHITLAEAVHCTASDVFLSIDVTKSTVV